MNKFKSRLALLSFVTSFFIRFGIFLLAGVILCIVGTRVRVCLGIGLALITFDLIVSVIEMIKTFRTLKTSDHPVIKGINEAMNSDDPYGEMDKLTENAYRRSGFDAHAADLAVFFLKDIFNRMKDKTASDCVDKFEECCAEPIPGETLIMECGPVKDSDKEYAFSLIRQYPGEEGGEYRIFMSMIFDLNDENKDMIAMVKSSEIDEEFFSYVRSSDIYKYSADKKLKDLRVGSE